MEIITDHAIKKHGIQILLTHLESAPNAIKDKLLQSDGFYSKMEILRLTISEIHCKAGR